MARHTRTAVVGAIVAVNAVGILLTAPAVSADPADGTETVPVQVVAGTDQRQAVRVAAAFLDALAAKDTAAACEMISSADQAYFAQQGGSCTHALGTAVLNPQNEPVYRALAAVEIDPGAVMVAGDQAQVPVKDAHAVMLRVENGAWRVAGLS